MKVFAELVHRDISHLLLLLFDGTGGIDHVKADFLNHRFVFFENAPLKEPEAFFDVSAQTQVHTRFIELDRVAAAENPANSHFEWNAKIEREIGPDRKF